MELFGPFEAGRVLDSGNGAVVYEARKEGDAKGKYVVKVFSPERLLTEEQAEAKPELDPLFRDLGASFTSRVNLQKQAAETSPWFAPILAGGHDARGAWYATDFYARSVKGMLERFVALEAADLFHVIHSVVKAAIHLKKTCGRSHGNLKPPNVFVEGVRRARSSRVRVADPLPGDAAEAERYERADLRSIGELLYQLVVRKKVDFEWVMVPLESSPDWEKLFGKKAGAWLALCNQLLDKNLSLQQVTLEGVERDLRRLEPKPPVPIVPTAIAVGVVMLAALAAFFLLQKRNSGFLVVKTDLPGSQVLLTPRDQYGNWDDAQRVTNTAAPDGVWKGRLNKGWYRVKVEYKSPYGDLPSPLSVPLAVEAGKPLTTNISLPYGGLVVSSEPAGAEFVLFGITNKTPFTNLYLPPTNITFQLRLAGFETTNFDRTVPSNHQKVEIATVLRKPPPGSALVEFASDPPGADVFVDSVRLGKAGNSFSIEVGEHEIGAEIPPWFGRQSRKFQVEKGANPLQEFRFAHGVLSVRTSSPPVLKIFLDERLVGFSPTNLSLPPASYALSFQADGYETNRLDVMLIDKTTNSLAISLKPLAGFVLLASDPPGARVLGPGGQLLTNTIPGMVTRLALPPGTNELTITFANLDPVWKTNFVTRPGQSNLLGTFRFRYGTVIFTNARPQEIPADLAIQPETGAKARFGELLYLKPGAALAYRAELNDYESWAARVSVAENAVTNVPIRLQRKKVPLVLQSNLEGTSYSYVDEEERLADLGQGASFNLPWGTNALIARLSNLRPLTNTLVVPRSGSITSSFAFSDYGVVITTNLSPGTEILQTEAGATLRLGRAPAPFYARPGAARFLLSSGGVPMEMYTNVTRAGWVVLALPMPPITSPASGMEFVWVAGLPGTPNGGYVGVTEVTQEQYEKISPNNASEPKDLKLPVNNLDARAAEAFCAQLTERDRSMPWISKGFRYVLPTVAQWDYLTNAANPTLGVFSASSSAPLSRPSPPRTKPVDGNGLYDLYGNVWEICRGSGQTDYRIRGGCFGITFRAVGIMMRQSQDRFERPDFYIGFRVIAVPAGP